MSRLIPENPYTSTGWHSRQNLEGVRWRMTNKIIPFEYCSLARAARFFDCEEIDFLHWWAIDKIDLCLYVEDGMATILSTDNNSIEFIKLQDANSALYNDERPYDFKSHYSSYFIDSIEKDGLSNVFRLYGEMWGLWCPARVIKDRLINGLSINDDFWIKPYSFDGDFRVINSSLSDISINSLVIPRAEMIKIQKILSGDDDDFAYENMNEVFNLLGGIINVLKKAEPKNRRWTQDSLKAELLNDQEGCTPIGISARKIDDHLALANKIFKEFLREKGKTN
ncbi:hypothetical protein BIY27_23120 [Gibbsiella quercinecans]|uniref:hypothetical protein n=1 Tax=Gibbsiella quercinecans TaxID=929813 RepID=UPI000EF27399|nr:hypothetical protein [Gibbsiella quercinecans]RLM03899.1 hypothetical protein BIY27_23120 [Gibbsiella quercinecans]